MPEEEEKQSESDEKESPDNGLPEKPSRPEARLVRESRIDDVKPQRPERPETRSVFELTIPEIDKHTSEKPQFLKSNTGGTNESEEQSDDTNDK